LAGVSGNVTIPAVGKVLTGTAYGVGGTGSTGTLTIPTASFVLDTAPAYGEPGAQLTPSLTSRGTWNLTSSFPGAGYYAGVSNSPLASTIVSGTTITGVAGSGTLESHSNCSADGATGCVTTASFKSADMTNVTAGNIKSGVTIAGQLGDFPSATYTLPSSSGTDLTSATFNAQIKSSGTFQYFDSAGARYSATGDVDITAGNISSGVDIFGTTGTLSGGAAPNAWDVRVGTVVNGVTGKLKVNCRNRANPSVFDIDQGQAATITTGSPGTVNITAHGLANTTTVRINYSTTPTGLSNGTTYYVVNAAANTLQLSLTSGGAAINITSAGVNVTVHKWQATPQSVDSWDTIDDYNNNLSGLPGTVVSGWTNNDCGGVEATAGDGNIWKDVTTSNGVTASSCGTTATNCTMQDKITGLWWSKQQTNGAWNAALATCVTTLNTTTYAGNSAAGYNGQTGWRLPTQKELLDAYNHGIRSAASDTWATGSNSNWITEAAMNSFFWFWSGSTVSFFTYNARIVYLGAGSTNDYAKNGSGGVVCVRP
jgi:hypothetical protein